MHLFNTCLIKAVTPLQRAVTVYTTCLNKNTKPQQYVCVCERAGILYESKNEQELLYICEMTIIFYVTTNMSKILAVCYMAHVPQRLHKN